MRPTAKLLREACLSVSKKVHILSDLRATWERPDAMPWNILKLPRLIETLYVWICNWRNISPLLRVAPLTLGNWLPESPWFVDGAVIFWYILNVLSKGTQHTPGSMKFIWCSASLYSCCRQLSVIVLVPYWSALVWTNAKRRAWGGAIGVEIQRPFPHRLWLPTKKHFLLFLWFLCTCCHLLVLRLDREILGTSYRPALHKLARLKYLKVGPNFADTVTHVHDVYWRLISFNSFIFPDVFK